MKRERVSVSLKPASHSALDVIAAREERTQPEVLRMMVEDLLPVFGASNLSVCEFRNELVRRFKVDRRSTFHAAGTVLRFVPAP
jgi:hypothetical protein